MLLNCDALISPANASALIRAAQGRGRPQRRPFSALQRLRFYGHHTDLFARAARACSEPSTSALGLIGFCALGAFYRFRRGESAGVNAQAAV
jgi:hypothetical protein